ncbi:MAG: hypothetical protein HRU20_17510 [Pseudomonadales bacterium]|nr:hypothetical protein [Pseudomonadales bacterium]
MPESKTTKSSTKKTQVQAKNILFASIGVYGKALDQLHGQYDKVSTESHQLFDELVAKGKTVEIENHNRFKDLKIKTAKTIDGRLHKLSDNLTIDHHTEDLQDQFDVFSDKLDLVIHALSSKHEATEHKSAHNKAH